MALFPWIGDQASSLWGSLFGSSSPGAVGSSVYGPPSSAAPSQLGGLLDPQGIRQQAFFQGLGSLGQGLLAAGLPHPATQGSLIPQALGAFQPAYNAGIQSGGQMAALEQQAIDQQRMEQLRRSDPRYANLPTQALIAQASRPAARPMTDAESIRNFGSVIPGAYFDGTSGAPSLPRGPLQEELTAAATARGDVGVRGVDLGFTGQRGYPNVSGGAPPAVVTPPTGGATPPVTPAARSAPPQQRPLAGGQPGVDRPFTGADMLRANPGISQADADARAASANEIYPVAPGATPGATPAPSTTPTPAPTQTAQAPATSPPRVRSTDPQMRTSPGYGRVFGTDQAALERARAAALQQNTYVTEHIIPDINSGVTQLQNIQRMREAAADPNMRFGTGSGVAAGVADFIRSWGGEQGAALANRFQSAGYAGLESLSASQVIAGLGGSLGRVTDADARIIGRTVPNPLQSRETFTRFLDLVQERATVNMQTAHNAYRRTVPDWNPQTDAISAHLAERLDAMGIDPGPVINPPPRQRGTGGARPPAPATTTPPPPPPPPPPVQVPTRNGTIDFDALSARGADARYTVPGQPGTWRWVAPTMGRPGVPSTPGHMESAD